MTRTPQKLLAVLAGTALPTASLAHSFGEVHTLPIPFWLYAWGAGATLIVSFAVVGLMGMRRAAAATPIAPPMRARHPLRLPAAVVSSLQALSVAGIAASILTGWLGVQQPYANFNMTFFWIVFVLGLTYLTALVGNLYALINPWRCLATLLARIWRGFDRSRLPYSEALGYWPALVLYMAFIWIELIGGSAPYSLAWQLAGYSAIQLLGIFLFGSRAWLAHGEIFAVFFRLIARMAPVAYAHDDDPARFPSRDFRLRAPLSGLHNGAQAGGAALLLFVLFMLSSTAFDSLHETQPWYELYWLWFYPEVLAHWLGPNAFAAFPELRTILQWWNTAWLLASPFVYLLPYLAAVWLMDRMTGREYGARQLALCFLPSLLPIAFVYHLAHYYTLLQTQAPKMLALISDPFGYGHDWLGTAEWFQRTNAPDMTTVWHAQVGLILLGHVLGVYVAHREALRCFGSRGRAVLSQLPMLTLMLGLTIGGLWILAQPFQGSV